MILIDESAFTVAARTIEYNYGSLDDLPRDLANTVCNIYYLSFLLANQANARGELLGPYLDGLTEAGYIGYIEFINLNNRTTVDLYCLPEEVAALRKMSASLSEIRDPRAKSLAVYAFNYCLTETLDTYKYGIKDAGKKSAIRRSIERKRKTPRGIPDLINRMKAAGFSV